MKIDINCDVGEGIANEHLLMPHISSCNIACGGHFGDKKTIDETLKLALEHNVKIGAHPSFPDKENFGRQLMQISNEELMQSIENQLELFLERLKKVDTKLHHIKPHGALYNAIAKDEHLAKVFLKTIKKYMVNAYLYVSYQSEIEKVALQENINIKYEVFADRNYNDDLTLVSRSQENAVISDETKVLNHILEIARNKQVKTVSGKFKPIKADTFCVHGDTKNALEILKKLTKELPKYGIEIAK